VYACLTDASSLFSNSVSLELHISPMDFEVMFLIVKAVYEMERRIAKERNKFSFHFKKSDKLLTQGHLKLQ